MSRFQDCVSRGRVNVHQDACKDQMQGLTCCRVHLRSTTAVGDRRLEFPHFRFSTTPRRGRCPSSDEEGSLDELPS